ncbi:glycosyltransferase [Colwellia sp. MB02u-18]|jgi:glycosyltransferase involved in cell wall biosynthesis|uniref:glycosyltransferase n=1 Tax=unclassified Colwellia TaxID=196834 RepID=UPI0015F72C69|nr:MULTISPECIES: glycosyltransferase [unclassified Colwellia]MBA6224521.1 glycosyltransferase [Colwellia sp. MB3u-45]MBA6267609.1 glycosyltransferase [Colwellia sp. MB3u-43]MBA6322215.1 glycosyltransferase [Colwellia sp. MB02u-19]MBA6326197.1 glycosyltransferase [Colwellia sp. MB02u-18]MBA6331656.1 glycosyltransferase [Colwellia sp. MB02u-12]
MKKNYLFVIDRIENGGAERQMLKVANYISSDINIFITSLHKPSNELLSLIEKYDFLYISIATSDGSLFYKRMFGILSLIKSLKEILSCHQIDKCISFLEWSNVLTIIATRKKGIPVCINVRNHLSTQYGSRSPLILKLAKIIIGKYYPLADKVLCNSYGIKNDLVKAFKVPNNLVDVIQNTYPIEIIKKNIGAYEFRERNVDSNLFCACGRLSDQKRFESLVLSFQYYIKKSQRNDTLIIIGSGTNENNIKQLIQAGDADIKLYSHQENPFPIIAACDSFILHSDFEGYPNVLAEALILGKDCISVDCLTGPREVLSGNTLTDYESAISELKMLKYGLLYPYKKINEEVDYGLVGALIKYSNNKFIFNKIDYDFLCEKGGRKKWREILLTQL